jgi:quaternary ammonium compound-resistance protein SugE
MILMKKSKGFTNLLPSLLFLPTLLTSFFLLSQAIKVIPLGTAYAVFTGIGAAGTVIVGILFFKDPFTFARVAFVSVIIIGVIGLKMAGGEIGS